MDNLLICANAVLPLFVLMAVGYVARLAGIVKREDVPAMNKVCFNVFLSTMAFNGIYTSDFSSSLNLPLLGFVSVAVLTVFGLCEAFVRIFVKRPRSQSVMAQGMARTNFVMLGFAVAQNLMPGGDIGVVAVLMAVVIPLFNVLSVVILSVHGSEGADWGNVLRKIATNPLILGTLSGLACVGLGVHLPSPIEACVRQVASAAMPLALFLLGAFFEFGSLRTYRRELAVVCIARLLVIPTAVLAVGIAAGIDSVGLVALIAVFAPATATASFSMAQEMGADADLAGAIVATTSAFCPLSLFVISYTLMSLGFI